MRLISNLLIYSFLCAGVQCVDQISWLPCQFTDERVSVNNKGHIETQLLHRDAMLQFGQKGDSPVIPHAVTFLVTGSRLDLRRYVEGVEAEQLECEMRRYSTEGIHVRWPVKGDKEYNRWFICTLKHTKGLFTVTGFLRQPSDQPPSGKPDYHSWSVIGDTEILSTTATMVMKTQSPSVKAGLRTQQKLHCQFAVDHKGPDVTTEWYWQHRGERTRLFSHTSRSGQTQGAGVDLMSLSRGDASYTLHSSRMSSEGTYVCSVSVKPLTASLDISLHIEERPRVSLNVGPTLSLLVGEEQRVLCKAARYYPRDVVIVWSHQDPAVSGQKVGTPVQEVHHLSHKTNRDETFSLSAFFYLKPSLRDSGRQFTCSVSHQSLQVPITESFILTVAEPVSWLSYLARITAFLLLVALGVKLLYLYLGRLQAQKYTY